MPISILPNQALAFNLDTTNKCNTNYFLPVQRGDNIHLQGTSTQVSPANKVPNGSFTGTSSWTLGTGFSIASQKLSHTMQATTSSATSAALNLGAGKLYRFYCQVNVTGLNGATTNHGVVIKVNDVYMPLPGTPQDQGYNQSFSITTFFYVGAVASDKVEITTNYPGIAFEIANVEVVEFLTPAVAINTLSGVGVQGFSPVTYYFPQTSYTALQDTITQARFDLFISLDTVPDGCYYLTIGERQPIGDPYFADTGYWTKGGWTFASHAATSTSTANILSGTAVLTGGNSYTINYTAAGLNTHVDLILKIDFGDGHPVSVTNFTTNSAQSITFTCGGTTGAAVNAVISFQAVYHTFGDSTAFSVSISNVYFNVTQYLQSNNISFQTTFPFPTLYFTATNADNAFNFDYSNGLQHCIRLWAKMRYKEYKTQADEANFSDNSNVLLTAYLEKIYEVTIGDAAEFVHDCMAMMQINDTFNINNTPYIRDGSYNLRLRKSTELSPAVFDIKPVQGIGKNWNII